MSDNLTITIDLGKRCAECGKPGATDSGICIRCAQKCYGTKPLKSLRARMVRERILALDKKLRGSADEK